MQRAQDGRINAVELVRRLGAELGETWGAEKWLALSGTRLSGDTLLKEAAQGCLSLLSPLSHPAGQKRMGKCGCYLPLPN